MGVLPPNLRTLHHLLKANRKDFATAISKSHTTRQRHDAWRRLVSRRCKAVRLVEELGLRTQRLQPLLDDLREISRRMDMLMEELKELLIPYLIEDGAVDQPPTAGQDALLDSLMPLVQERLKKLSDTSEMTRFLFTDIPVPESADLKPKKSDAVKTIELLNTAAALLDAKWDEGIDVLEEAFRETSEELGIGLGALLMPVRAAATGSWISPPLFESLRLLGKERTLERIQLAAEKLQQEVQ